MPSDGPKKRRAPLPPAMMSLEATTVQGADQEVKPQSPTHTDGLKVSAEEKEKSFNRRSWLVFFVMKPCLLLAAV